MTEVNKVLVVDDHPIVRLGVKSVISKMPQFQLMAEANNGKEAQQIVMQGCPEIIILDISMPAMNGIEFLNWLKENCFEPLILILTHHVEEALTEKALKNPLIKALLHKGSVLQDLEQALSFALQGRSFFSREFEKYQEALFEERQIFADKLHIYNQLTKTEKVVLKLVAREMSSEKIAEELGKSIRTIEYHRYNICQKLNLTGHQGLIIHAISNQHIIMQLDNK